MITLRVLFDVCVTEIKKGDVIVCHEAPCECLHPARFRRRRT